MRIVAITAVKNEIDVIEAFVRHTLVYACRLVVLDNGSTDGTLGVLRALADEGLPLDILEDPSAGHFQSWRLTGLMREDAVGRHWADWVLPLDADQFVTAERGSLVPERADPGRPVAIPWHDYVPDPGDNGSQRNPVLRIRNRMANGCNAQIVLVPGRLASLPDAVLPQGHHQLEVAGSTVEAVIGEAHLGHFPIRSQGQFLAKIAIARLQYQTMAKREPDLGLHYREPFELLKRDPAAFLTTFHDEARTYLRLPGAVADPRTVLSPFPYRGGPLRYTPESDDESHGWRTVLEYAEQLAVQFALVSEGMNADERDSAATAARLMADLRADLDRQVRLRQTCEAEKEHVIQEQHAALLRQGQLLREYQEESQARRPGWRRLCAFLFGRVRHPARNTPGER